MQDQKVKRFNELIEQYIMYSNAYTLFEWDQSTGAPSGGDVLRSKNMGKLSGKIFDILTSDEMNELISYFDKNKDKLDDVIKASTRDLLKYNDSYKKIDSKLIAEYNEYLAIAGSVWEKAKTTNDFDLFAPYLEKIIEYGKTFIDLRGYKDKPYNLLLDDFEDDMIIDKLDVFFENLKTSIVPLLAKIKEKKLDFDSSFLRREVPIEKQKQFSNYLIEVLGFDMNRGMIRESEHPFSTHFNNTDVRITTHYHKDDVLSSMFSVIHEAGHGIYEQNIDDSITSTYLGSGVSNGIHESQSRFYENIIGRSYEFWQLIYPKFIEIFHDEFKDITLDQFYIASNLVNANNCIRIEADELTYSLHVMIRYEIEKEIFNNKLTAYQIRDLWNKKYKDYLGVTPPNDAKGILQDVHWSSGYFGYFPSYALGSAYASMIKHHMDKDLDVSSCIKNNDIKKITSWLRDKIHKSGGVIKPNDLMINNFKEPFNPTYYKDYLVEKFSKIYNL